MKLVAVLSEQRQGKILVWRGASPLPKLNLDIIVEPPENCYWEWIDISEDNSMISIYAIDEFNPIITGMNVLETGGASRQIGQPSDDRALFWQGDSQSFRGECIVEQVIRCLRGDASHDSVSIEVFHQPLS